MTRLRIRPECRVSDVEFMACVYDPALSADGDVFEQGEDYFCTYGPTALDAVRAACRTVENGSALAYFADVRRRFGLEPEPSWCTPYMRDVQPAQAITLGTDLPTSFADGLRGLLLRECVDYLSVRVRLYDDEWQPGEAADYRLTAVLDDLHVEGEHVAIVVPTDDDGEVTGPPRRVPTGRMAHLHVH